MALHVIPINDEKEHEHSDCWCEPRTEWQDPETGAIYPRGPMVVHNAADHREACEVVTGDCLESGKGWMTVEY